ncbi:unnamed protein product, partial [Vitis vinifera]
MGCIDIAIVVSFPLPWFSTSLRVSRDHSIPLTPFHHSSLTLCFLHKFNSTLEFCPKDTKHALRLEKRRMYNYCAYDLLFLHFGTSNEVLDYLSELMEMEEKLVRKNRVLFKSKLAVGSW